MLSEIHFYFIDPGDGGVREMTWHGRPTKFKKGDIITHPTRNIGRVVQVTSAETGYVLGVMGKIAVQIQNDPDWVKLNEPDREATQ